MIFHHLFPSTIVNYKNLSWIIFVALWIKFIMSQQIKAISLKWNWKEKQLFISRSIRTSFHSKFSSTNGKVLFWINFTTLLSHMNCKLVFKIHFQQHYHHHHHQHHREVFLYNNKPVCMSSSNRAPLDWNRVPKMPIPPRTEVHKRLLDNVVCQFYN